MGNRWEYNFALYHDTGFPHEHVTGGDTVVESSGNQELAGAPGAGGSGGTSVSVTTGSGALPPPPAGFTVIPGTNTAYGSNPATGGTLYLNYQPYADANGPAGWRAGAGQTQPPQINVNAGPAFTGIPESELISRAQAAGGTITDYGVYKTITYPDGSQVRADPSIGPGGQMYYNVSITGGSSSNSNIRLQNSAGTPTVVPGASTNTSGTGSVVTPSSGAGTSQGSAWPASGKYASYGSAIPKVSLYDPVSGKYMTENAQFDIGTETGGILQRNNPYITPTSGVATSYGAPKVSPADFARELTTQTRGRDADVISAYGGEMPADPIAAAAAANYLHNKSLELMNQGYTPIQAQQYIQMEQQKGRGPTEGSPAPGGLWTDPFYTRR